uniref:Uncharacterized protein n=1 Tax=Ciona intestinalis TaxID=7719 RepID=H2XY44_CIOIN
MKSCRNIYERNFCAFPRTLLQMNYLQPIENQLLIYFILTCYKLCCCFTTIGPLF